jgi:hypothetical protein
MGAGSGGAAAGRFFRDPLPWTLGGIFSMVTKIPVFRVKRGRRFSHSLM